LICYNDVLLQKLAFNSSVFSSIYVTILEPSFPVVVETDFGVVPCWMRGNGRVRGKGTLGESGSRSGRWKGETEAREIYRTSEREM
jgi:hypothetical protein